MEKENRLLYVELTHSEWENRAEELAKANINLEELESERKTSMEEFKDKISSKKTVISKLSEMVDTRQEEREVECIWVFNAPRRGMKQLVRQDTYETVDERDMTDYDKRKLADSLQMKIV